MSKVPKRIQRKRTKGSKLPPNTLCCTRPSPFSNPFIGGGAAKWFGIWLVEHPQLTTFKLVVYANCHLGYYLQLHKSADHNQTAKRYLDNLEELRQYDFLACWCGPEDDCHCDTYIKLLTAGGCETS